MFTSESSPMLDNCHTMRPIMMDRKWKTNVELAPNCPRCASTNTKFCYYNNYSLSQPRYFCKGCRRYWTKGGSLRNVPVGGGCRKSRRSKSARQAAEQQQQQRASSAAVAAANHESENMSSEIDMAVVFAKYLSSPGGATTTSSNTSASLAPSSLESESQRDDILLEYYGQDNQDNNNNLPMFMDPAGSFNNVVNIQENAHDQDFLDYNHPSDLDLEALLGDDDDHHQWPPIMSDGPNFSWQQPMMMTQEQDFGTFLVDDDYSTAGSTTLANDVWGSFDLPGYEILPRQ